MARVVYSRIGRRWRRQRPNIPSIPYLWGREYENAPTTANGRQNKRDIELGREWMWMLHELYPDAAKKFVL